LLFPIIFSVHSRFSSVAFEISQHPQHSTYRRHNHLSLEASSDSVIDTLWLSPAGWDTHEAVRLMSEPWLPVYTDTSVSTILRSIVVVWVRKEREYMRFFTIGTWRADFNTLAVFSIQSCIYWGPQVDGRSILRGGRPMKPSFTPIPTLPAQNSFPETFDHYKEGLHTCGNHFGGFCRCCCRWVVERLVVKLLAKTFEIWGEFRCGVKRKERGRQ